MEVSETPAKPLDLELLLKHKRQDTKALKELFEEAHQKAVKEDGWAMISSLYKAIKEIEPEFSPIAYGYDVRFPKLFMLWPDVFVIETEKTAKGKSILWVQLKTKP